MNLKQNIFKNATSQWPAKFQKPKQPSLPPGPKPWPIVGNLPQFIKHKNETSASDWIHSLVKEMNTDIACIRLGNVHVIPVTCPEISREFLKKQDAVFASKDRLPWPLINSDEGGLVNLRVAARNYCSNVMRKILFSRRYLGEGKADGEPGLDLDGHEKIVVKATRVMEKYQDPIIEDRIRQWRDGKKVDPQDLLDVLVSLTDENVQESDFPQLNYVKACAREAFRLHPISTFNPPHVSVTDTTVAGYFIPKGSHVVLSQEGLGRNPKVWDDPSGFKPERHLQGCNEGEQVVLADPELRLLSFSIGRRGCPGVVLGSSMTTMLFARPLQGFEWSIPGKQAAIDLSQGKGESFLAKPLLSVAKPRLPPNVYSFLT
ncbi:hypothetical protein F3Y22_tig00111099pilonHSYRG00109 [Hibiscus syriacus]|uniref:Uncharacterized protein n=1 Tax=Hibiscus syriacus TaxID=106335 RepID=A0A6A2Z0S3_HIBSY|nr:hypothetical protein F3Y22_tig00111099pilonHSYRG00109 [Hibiscus syriacus]